MDHDDATIGRIFTRRQALVAAGRTGLLLGAASFLGRSVRAAGPTTFPAATPATRPVALVAAPQLTEGPFFVDERLNRSDLVAGTDRPSVRDAMSLAISVAVYKLAAGIATPMPGMTVDVWSADAHGAYSDEDDEQNVEATGGQRWLRGYQVTDAAGLVAFRTIFPGWYEGRAPHVHFKVRQFAAGARLPATRPTVAAAHPLGFHGPAPIVRGVTAEFTSQWFFPDAVASAVYTKAPYDRRGHQGTRNGDDGIYTEPLSDGSPAGAQMTLALRDDPAVRGGRSAAFALYLTEASLHDASDHGPRGPGGPGGPPPDGGPFGW